MFLFRANKTPDFVTLQTANAHLAPLLVMVFGTRLAQINEELAHRVYGDIR
jgi:hypothetical protein